MKKKKKKGIDKAMMWMGLFLIAMGMIFNNTSLTLFGFFIWIMENIE